MQGMAESWNLDGQVAIVTGAERGIGRVTAELLHARGARVVASDVSDGVHELAGEGYATMTGDVADEDVARRTVALAIERFGRLDILVNNAGRTLNKPLLETSVADWDAVMTTNARGNFVHARVAVRAMVANGGGAIVSVVSVVARIAMPELDRLSKRIQRRYWPFAAHSGYCTADRRSGRRLFARKASLERGMTRSEVRLLHSRRSVAPLGDDHRVPYDAVSILHFRV